MRKSVLVVDDAPTVRTQLTGFLAAEYRCLEASNGQEAMLLIERDPPDAIVADLAMPEMDGIALLRALRSSAATEKLPVVIVTSGASLELVNECRSLGCSGFVLKPVQRDYLLAKVRQLIVAG